MDKDNLLNFPFGSSERIEDNPHLISHPASKNYPLEEDYIASMISEGGRPEPSELLFEFKDELKENIDREDSTLFAVSLVRLKLNRLLDHTKRIRYYMKDINDFIID